MEYCQTSTNSSTYADRAVILCDPKRNEYIYEDRICDNYSDCSNGQDENGELGKCQATSKNQIDQSCCNSYIQTISSTDDNVRHILFEVDTDRGPVNNRSSYIDYTQEYSIEYEAGNWFVWKVFGPQTTPEFVIQGDCPDANKVRFTSV